MTSKSGLQPVTGTRSRVLILGSMPGEASLQKQQYYAYRHNAFWPILAELFGFQAELSYAERLTKLTEQGLALWDVIASCQRTGSLDSAIVTASIVVNDFMSLYKLQPDITHVVFNGQKAQLEYRRHVLTAQNENLPRLQYHLLPSTSPANARLRFADKLSAWSLLHQLLRETSAA